ncbi:ABC transporter permease [Labrys monachus]|uniref:Peptide/nickel transport system permease protein n=1 Tax=Labrys monachus TaxID=217067 RepID=A0ABU0FJX6_9HYPH|nr:ABC transporter permease [Labrys monachus]MDQ0394918.1 peptide/nickel transport system permease protein [Labrys monachus]
MTRLILSRLLSALPNLAGVVLLTFILTRMLPGDPAAYFAGPAATPQSIEQVRQQLGLARSAPEQFYGYVLQLARGDLGKSLTSGQTVLDDLVARLPASLELTVAALLLASLAGISLGVGAAVRPGGVVDHLCGLLSALGQAMPTFFLGLLLVFVFYYLLGWAPAPLGRLDIGYPSPDDITGFWLIDTLLEGDFDGFVGVFKQLVLPVVTLGLFGIGPIARMTRAGMIEVLGSDFVRTARAAGLPPWKVLWVYAFRSVLVPVLNTIGMVFSFMLGANVLVEKVFGWPGIGAYAIDSVLASDFAPIQGFVLLMAALYVLINLLIDIVAVLLDPRVRFDG